MVLEFYAMKIPIEQRERLYICMQELNKTTTKTKTKQKGKQRSKDCNS